MSKDTLKFYYEQIKTPASTETTIDDFWNNALQSYFAQDKSYGTELEQRPLDGLANDRANVAIRCIKHLNTSIGYPQTVLVVLMDNRRGRNVTQISKWSEAVHQLEKYMRLVRAENGADNALYAAISIRTYVRFYHVPSGGQELMDYPSTNGKAYELEDNEKEVHDILNQYVAKTAHQP
jgi:hypothetical protein